ncbi:hypothetical protein FOA52_004563 [Chlamydomonas sp. UWO 241]|nr:hypothetical protein FOA52_004563 [Chlamydomonas sp. UWO 241]
MSVLPGGKRDADQMEAVSTDLTTSFTWRIENFSKLTSDAVKSDCFEAGACTWQLRVYAQGTGHGAAAGTHLSVYLELGDDMWAPKVHHKVTLVNQADASKSLS